MKHRKQRAMTLASAITLVSALGLPTALAATAPNSTSGSRLFAESFTGGSATPGAWFSGGKGIVPCLTAGRPYLPSSIPACGWRTPDRPGHGALQITTNHKGQSGYVLYANSLPAAKGLYIKFSMYQYHRTTVHGADGISFFLIDGKATPTRAGTGGGWLGYKHLRGGYLGLGFDVYGNFAQRRLWGTGTQKRFPNSIVVRGAGTVGYRYLFGKHASGHIGFGTTASRHTARRQVLIRISTAGVMTVDINYGKGFAREINHLQLDHFPGQPKLPSTIKFGFAASTGAYTETHDITGFEIAELPPELVTTITADGPLHAGGTATYTANVGATWMSAPVHGVVTETITFPAGVTPTAASGPGWTCAVAGQVVTCTTTQHRKALGSWSPIGISAQVGPHAPSKVTVYAAASTPGMNAWKGDHAKVTSPLHPALPSRPSPSSGSGAPSGGRPASGGPGCGCRPTSCCGSAPGGGSIIGWPTLPGWPTYRWSGWPASGWPNMGTGFHTA